MPPGGLAQCIYCYQNYIFKFPECFNMCLCSFLDVGNIIGSSMIQGHESQVLYTSIYQHSNRLQIAQRSFSWFKSGRDRSRQSSELKTTPISSHSHIYSSCSSAFHQDKETMGIKKVRHIL